MNIKNNNTDGVDQSQIQVDRPNLLDLLGQTLRGSLSGKHYATYICLHSPCHVQRHRYSRFLVKQNQHGPEPYRSSIFINKPGY